jgi:uncharacterized protein YjaZ
MNYGKEVSGILKRFRTQKLKNHRFLLGRHRCLVVYESSIKEAVPIIEKALKRCVKILTPKSDITVIVVNSADEFVKNRMLGVAGYTLNNHIISFEINTDNSKWKKALTGTVAHEFNHALRFNFINGRFSLRDSMAFEGLAQCFEVEINRKVPPWSRALTKGKAEKVWVKIKPYLNSRSGKVYREIFFGSRKFPQWSGYTVSYIIVRKRLSVLKISWNEAIKLDSKKLV